MTDVGTSRMDVSRENVSQVGTTRVGTTRVGIPAVFARGGTSKAVIFHDRDLPSDHRVRDRVLLHVLGSPDPYQRQLDGLGGGVSSVSKAVIIAPSARQDADVDYTFAQVAVDQPVVDYGSMCGNMSSSVGPFAIDEGLVAAADGETCIRIYNTNTDKIVHARFSVAGGQTVEAGDFTIPGVPGSAAAIRLDYLSPGGAATGALLPTGHARDRLDVDPFGAIEVSLVDATNPVVFVRADTLGLTGNEAPDTLEAIPDLMAKLDAVRRAGAFAMGLADAPGSAALANPKVAIVSPAQTQQTLDGRTLQAEDHDITMRMVSMERIHRAVTLTGAKCLACAVQISGSICADGSAHRRDRPGTLRIATPSGVIPVSAELRQLPDGGWQAVSATSFRTQRRLMDGWVYVPETLIGPADSDPGPGR